MCVYLGDRGYRGEGGGWLGRGEAGGGTEWGGKGEGAMLPIYAGIMPCQPRKPQYQLVMGQPSDLEGKGLRMGGMDAELCREVVGYGASGGTATID